MHEGRPDRGHGGPVPNRRILTVCGLYARPRRLPTGRCCVILNVPRYQTPRGDRISHPFGLTSTCMSRDRTMVRARTSSREEHPSPRGWRARARIGARGSAAAGSLFEWGVPVRVASRRVPPASRGGERTHRTADLRVWGSPGGRAGGGSDGAFRFPARFPRGSGSRQHPAPGRTAGLPDFAESLPQR